MGLTKTQRALITKVRTAGASEVGVYLDDAICSYLVAIIVKDLGLSHYFPEVPSQLPAFFSNQPLSELRLESVDFLELLARIIHDRTRFREAKGENNEVLCGDSRTRIIFID